MLADMAADDQPALLRRLARAQHNLRLSETNEIDSDGATELPDAFYGWGSLRPPPRRPHLFREIVYNELAIAVSCEYLGDENEPTLTTCASPFNVSKSFAHRGRDQVSAISICLQSHLQTAAFGLLQTHIMYY
jgi:hypothetical protein